MNDITALMASMKAAAEKASNDDWVKESGEGWEAICSANDQANGGFIIAHFEGPDAGANREFVQVANPANVKMLVEALEKAQQSNEFLKGQLSDLANFNPDWDKLEASYESWRKIAAELLVAKDRIASLESRAVTVKLPAEYLNADGSVNADMANTCPVVSAYREAHRAAGIQVIEGEG